MIKNYFQLELQQFEMQLRHTAQNKPIATATHNSRLQGNKLFTLQVITANYYRGRPKMFESTLYHTSKIGSITK